MPDIYPWRLPAPAGCGLGDGSYCEVDNVLVQQAIFSSGRRREREGFHLVGRSSGLTKADAQLLVRQLPWCDAMSPTDRPAGMCYCELSDDSICISRTIRLSDGPVARGLVGHEGAQLHTHCFVVPREVFGRFAHNPFAILQAVAASGFVLSHEPAGGKLQPIRLAGHAPAIDHTLLANLARFPGAAALAGLLHEAIERERLIVVGQHAEELLSGLMNVLPVGERAQFSFSIGLRPSLRRPVRIVAVAETSLQIERFARQCRYKLLKSHELGYVDYQDHAWVAQVRQAIEEANFSWLAQRVAAPTVPGIDSRAIAASETAERSGKARTGAGTAAAGTAAAGTAAGGTAAGGTAACAAAGSTAAANSGGGSSAGVLDANPNVPQKNSAAGSKRAGSQQRDRARLHHDVASNDPAALEMLEQLDDLVYDAIAGRPGALQQLTDFWPDALAQLEGEALVESREQYLRYALGLWSQGDAGGIQDPQRAMGALDVLCLLFPEGEF